MHTSSKFSWIYRGIFLVFALAALAGCAQQPQRPEKAGFVIQVSDNDAGKWNLALNNARNVQQALGADKADVEIVAYGPGLNMLKFDSLVASKIEEAQAGGIKVIACGNTMKSQKVTEQDLVRGVGVVGSGVIEIGDKQQKGWTYVRP